MMLMSLGASAPPSQPATDKWQVNLGEAYCSLGRETAGPHPTRLVIRMLAGGGEAHIIVRGDHSVVPNIAKGDKLSVVLEPSGVRVPVEVSRAMGSADSRAVLLTTGDRVLPQKFIGAQRIRLEFGENSSTISFPPPDKGVVALQQCMDEALVDWGIDPKALATLRSPPASVGRTWMDSDDYPITALGAGIRGNVVARLDLDAAGKVKACTIVQSGGSGVLDGRVCSQARRGARYYPAIGADGQPTAAPQIVLVQFVAEGWE
jgi:TonB family protein